MGKITHEISTPPRNRTWDHSVVSRACYHCTTEHPIVTKWMVKICQVAWDGGVPADWTKAIIVPVYKGKGKRGECGSYRGISLLSIPGKVYGKVIIERVRRLTEEKISNEQGGFRKGRGCVEQVFSFRIVVEKILAKGKKYMLPSWI